MAQNFDAQKPALNDPLTSEPMRVNFQAVISLNSGPTAPSDPQEGWPWFDTSDPTNIKLKFFIGGTWVTGLANVQAGPPSQSNVDKEVFTQSVAATTWTVNHSLDSDELSVTCIDTSTSPDTIMIPDTVEFTSTSVVTITFLTPQAGKAVLLG